MAKFATGKFNIVRFDTESELDIIESYDVNGATVHITQDGRYHVSEPLLSKDAESIWSRLMDNLYYFYSNPGNIEVVQSIKNRLEEETRQTAVIDTYIKEKEAIEYYLIRDIQGYHELDVLMNDPHIDGIVSALCQ